MMEYDEQCKLDPTMPLNNPCTRYNIHLATLVIINLCTVMMSQSGDITMSDLASEVLDLDPWGVCAPPRTLDVPQMIPPMESICYMAQKDRLAKCGTESEGFPLDLS
jgi:hypothetical protein